LLEETIGRLESRTVAVLEGDQETDRDAERIRKTGAPVLQINTGTGCHLDARMVASAFDALGIDEAPGSLIFIENVGNLVCPALFDLGEAAKVVVMSVTEGEDKPLKYPHVFRAASAVVLTKCDLLPHLDFSVDACLAHVRAMNPSLAIISTSAKTGMGIDDWCCWLRARSGRPAERRSNEVPRP
jgi:hydrogenase nickel incorporation protein HypB